MVRLEQASSKQLVPLMPAPASHMLITSTSASHVIFASTCTSTIHDVLTNSLKRFA